MARARAGRSAYRPPGPTYKAGSHVTLTAVPKDGWTFRRYSGGVQSKDPVTRLTINNDTAVEAVFWQKRYELDVQIQGNGTVVQDPQKDLYLHGEKVFLEPLPQNGWYLSHWVGDVQSIGSRFRVEMTADTSVKAVFVKNWITLPVLFGRDE